MVSNVPIDYEDLNKKTPNYLFSSEEIDILIKCVGVLTNERYFDQNEFINLTCTDNKARFVDSATKLRDNQELNEDDGYYLAQAVAHVAVYPMRHGEEVESQFDVPMRHLHWFSTYVEYLFDAIFKATNE